MYPVLERAEGQSRHILTGGRVKMIMPGIFGSPCSLLICSKCFDSCCDLLTGETDERTTRSDSVRLCRNGSGRPQLQLLCKAATKIAEPCQEYASLQLVDHDFTVCRHGNTNSQSSGGSTSPPKSKESKLSKKFATLAAAAGPSTSYINPTPFSLAKPNHGHLSIILGLSWCVEMKVVVHTARG